MHQKGNWTPSIIPRGDNHNICLVLDDLGRNGRVISAFALAILLTVAGLRVGMTTKERPAALDRHSYSYVQM